MWRLKSLRAGPGMGTGSWPAPCPRVGETFVDAGDFLTALFPLAPFRDVPERSPRVHELYHPFLKR